MSESETTPPPLPERLGERGAKLWRDLTALHDLTDKPAELEMLAEACRIADRLEKLDQLLAGGTEEWARFKINNNADVVLMIDGALAEARQQQNVFKQILAALRLPEEVGGKRPQARSNRGGVYQPKGSGKGASGATVTALERARAARGGA